MNEWVYLGSRLFLKERAEHRVASPQRLYGIELSFPIAPDENVIIEIYEHGNRLRNFAAFDYPPKYFVNLVFRTHNSAPHKRGVYGSHVESRTTKLNIIYENTLTLNVNCACTALTGTLQFISFSQCA